MEGDAPRIIENSEGHRTTPSFVGFTEKGERIVGIAAKRQVHKKSKNLFDFSSFSLFSGFLLFSFFSSVFFIL